MELRESQDKVIGMPRSLGTYNPLNKESFSKFSSASFISPAAADGERERERNRNEGGLGHNSILSPSQTLDQQHLLHHHHQLNPQQERLTQVQARDSNPDPDPDPAPVLVPPSSNSATTIIRYRECLKNHAANTGRYILDGCGEFMASGDEGTLEALKCAACDCHRNFHRKEIDGDEYNANCHNTYNPNKNNSGRNSFQPSYFPPPPPPQPQPHNHQIKYTHVMSTTTGPGPMMMAFGGGNNSGGVLAESSSEDLNVFQSDVGMQQPLGHQLYNQASKKRFRTKFTKEQKDKMLEFADKLGWRIQKQDEEEVEQFCCEVGLKRQVFKVWMHNNKQAMKKKQL